MIFAIALAGLFAQECAENLRRSQEFRDDRVVYSEENFFDPDCRLPSVSSRSYGTYSIGGPAGDSWEIDFVFERVTFTPATEEVAAGYRARALCGLTNWEKGRETEITGLSCDFLDSGASFRVPPAGSVRFGIVKVERNSLRFGRLTPEFDGTAPDRRPRFLDSVPYLKQSRPQPLLFLPKKTGSAGR